MDNIKREPSKRTPSIDFNFTDNQFSIRGESYPEDVSAFFGAPISALEQHLNKMESGNVEFHFELIYFNSTSAKVMMRLFEILEETAQKGVAVTIHWHYDANDSNMEELGEEFAEDLEATQFNKCPK
ncbi:MAG: DUF1987 domain-containing protein [Magnetococcales bacterium]|nr:DUF1987 domain-containing protein [Magnetococcales bacterium]